MPSMFVRDLRGCYVIAESNRRRDADAPIKKTMFILPASLV